LLLKSLRSGFLAGLAVCWCCSIQAQEQALPATENLYQKAMQSLAEGRLDETRELLQQVLRLQPNHAGAWMDMAVLQCNTGYAADAEALFDAIENRFAPPPALLEVIRQLRNRGCKPELAKGSLVWRLGMGVDNNVNQGVSNLNFTTGSGESLVYLGLSSDYLPLTDQFTTIFAEFMQPLTSSGLLGFTQLQARQFDKLSRFDLSSLVLGLEQPWRLGAWGLRGVGSMAVTTLGGSAYQTLAQLQLHCAVPVALPKGWGVNVVGAWSGVGYPKLAGFDSQILESRAVATYNREGVYAQLSAGHAQDKGGDLRPGRDRSGAVVGLLGRTKLWGQVMGELGWNFQSWSSQQAYSPGLIEERRQQKTSMLRASLSVPVSNTQSFISNQDK
jgi:hypothetical protein